VLMLMPAFVERSLKIDFPTTLEIIIMLFIFAAEILGEISEYYVKYPNWDTILHTTNGFLCAAIGFAMVDVLNRSERSSLKLSPLYMAIVAFCFSMTIGVLWEFFEWGADCLLGLDMQKDTILQSISSVTLHPEGKNDPHVLQGIREVLVVLEDGSQVPLGLGGYLDIGLQDTMKDLLVNLIGALVFSPIGYLYIKTKGKGRIARWFIPEVLEKPEE